MPLSKKGKGLLATSVLSLVGMNVVRGSGSSIVDELFSFLFLVTLICFIVEWRSNRKAGLPLSKKGKGLLVAFAVSLFGPAVIDAPDASKISYVLVAAFYFVLIWLIFEWRTSRKAGRKLSKKGKWLLAATVFLFLSIGVSTIAEIANTPHDYQKTDMQSRLANAWYDITNQKDSETSSSK